MLHTYTICDFRPFAESHTVSLGKQIECLAALIENYERYIARKLIRWMKKGEINLLVLPERPLVAAHFIEGDFHWLLSDDGPIHLTEVDEFFFDD
jgi:hypothetical protein